MAVLEKNKVLKSLSAIKEKDIMHFMVTIQFTYWK